MIAFFSKFLFFFFLHLALIQPVYSCSMYKVTVDDKTMVGTNFDAWYATPHIWFETSQGYDCCFSGGRDIGIHGFAPQSGMNEHGLVFSRLGSDHPKQVDPEMAKRKKIDFKDLFLKDVLHACRNIDEVYAYWEQFDHSCFLDEIFIYIEPSGEYLIVEPYKLIRGKDKAYVLSNFCPSITTEVQKRKLGRYRKGADLLKAKQDTSLAFCRDVSDAMHVCRDKLGDGTLLTTVWDLKNDEAFLYFYHDYSNVVHIDLKDEFEKGDHDLEIDSLFPVNKEFEQFKDYITPFRSDALRMFLAGLGLFFLGCSIFFGVSWLKDLFKKKPGISKLLFVILYFLAFCYMFVMTTESYIYYFSAPFQHYKSTWISASSYIPYLLVFAWIFIGWLYAKKRAFDLWGKFSRGLIIANNALFMLLTIGFLYWGLLF